MMEKLKKVSNLVLIAACAAVIAYAVTVTVVQIVTGTELSPTLTTAWFSFWGVEIIALAAIKNCKTKHRTNTTENDCDEDHNE